MHGAFRGPCVFHRYQSGLTVVCCAPQAEVDAAPDGGHNDPCSAAVVFFASYTMNLARRTHPRPASSAALLRSVLRYAVALPSPTMCPPTHPPAHPPPSHSQAEWFKMVPSVADALSLPGYPAGKGPPWAAPRLGGPAVDSRAHFAVATPQKLPLEGFNEWRVVVPCAFVFDVPLAPRSSRFECCRCRSACGAAACDERAEAAAVGIDDVAPTPRFSAPAPYPRRSLKPYTAHPVRSLAELSEITPESPRGACFGRVALVKVGRGKPSGHWLAASEKVKALFLPEAPPSPWRSVRGDEGSDGNEGNEGKEGNEGSGGNEGKKSRGTTRVVIEQRPNAAARQFLNATEARLSPSQTLHHTLHRCHCRRCCCCCSLRRVRPACAASDWFRLKWRRQLADGASRAPRLRPETLPRAAAAVHTRAARAGSAPPALNPPTMRLSRPLCTPRRRRLQRAMRLRGSSAASTRSGRWRRTCPCCSTRTCSCRTTGRARRVISHRRRPVGCESRCQSPPRFLS